MASDTVFADPRSGFVTPWERARSRAVAAFVTANSYRYDRDWARSLFEDELALSSPTIRGLRYFRKRF